MNVQEEDKGLDVPVNQGLLQLHQSSFQHQDAVVDYRWDLKTPV
jgi:hypothetical protein